MTKKASLSLDDLDVERQCEDSHEFEYIDPSGKKTGVFISVVGSHAQSVKEFTTSELNKDRMKKAQAARKGKDQEYTPFEEDIDFMIKSAAIRIVGWRGIENECNDENRLRLCRINPLIRAQVLEESNNLANFTKSK